MVFVHHFYVTFLLDPRAQAKHSCIVSMKRLPEFGINNVTGKRGKEKRAKTHLTSRSSQRRDRYVICEVRGNSFEHNEKDKKKTFFSYIT